MTSQWKGSLATAANVGREIAERFGKEAAQEYDPTVNCFTFKGWKERGYFVKKGEKAIHSVTFVPMEHKDKVSGEVSINRVPRNVYLFYKSQVEKKD